PTRLPLFPYTTLFRSLSKAVGQNATQPQPQAAFLGDPKVARFVAALVKDLTAHQGRSAVLVGDEQPPEVHALGHRLNALLGNVGDRKSTRLNSSHVKI